MTPSTADHPFFFDAEHAALADRLSAAIREDDPDLHDAKRVVPRLGALGLLDIVAPEERVGVRSLCLAREALGYASALADSIFAVQGLGAHPLLKTPAFGGRERILSGARRGEIVLGFALTEPEAGTDVASLRSVARKVEGGDGATWRIDGEKTFISNVGIAHGFVVFANADPPHKKGISAFYVAHDAPGLELSSVPLSVDHPLGRLRMNGCEARLVGDVGAGLRLALGTLDVFRTSVGAAAIGMARRALDATVARVRERRQFGQRIADFQMTQAALADMATDIEAARLLVYRAAWTKDRDGDGSRDPRPVAMAKMFATEAAQRVIDRAVQLHGGLGVKGGSIVERLYREIRPLRIYEGTTEIQKLLIGSAIVG